MPGERTSYGTDYDRIAPSYDGQPYRSKEPDPRLFGFLAERGLAPERARVLDAGCGTGNQLVADLAREPRLGALTGLDPFEGMLAVARTKSARVRWVRGDATRMPFADASFDYATSQYSFHHLDRTKLLAEAFRVLAPGGRFVVQNVSPHDVPDSLLYRAFPAALEKDRAVFPTVAMLAEDFVRAGFTRVRTETVRDRWQTTRREFLARARRRDDCSQLIALSDADFAAGIARLEREPDAPVWDEVARMTVTGDREPA